MLDSLWTMNVDWQADGGTNAAGTVTVNFYRMPHLTEVLGNHGLNSSGHGFLDREAYVENEKACAPFIMRDTFSATNGTDCGLIAPPLAGSDGLFLVHQLGVSWWSSRLRAKFSDIDLKLAEGESDNLMVPVAPIAWQLPKQGQESYIIAACILPDQKLAIVQRLGDGSLLLRLGYGASDADARNFIPFASVEAKLELDDRCEIVPLEKAGSKGVVIATSNGSWYIPLDRAIPISKLDLPNLAPSLNGRNPNLLVDRLSDFARAVSKVIGNQTLLDGSPITSPTGVCMGCQTVIGTSDAMIPVLLRVNDGVSEFVQFQVNSAQSHSALGFSRSSKKARPLLARLRALDPASNSNQLDLTPMDISTGRVAAFADTTPTGGVAISPSGTDFWVVAGTRESLKLSLQVYALTNDSLDSVGKPIIIAVPEKMHQMRNPMQLIVTSSLGWSALGLPSQLGFAVSFLPSPQVAS